MASLCHPWFTTTNLSYRFPIFETSATALCGTTGSMCPHAELNTCKKETTVNPYVGCFIKIPAEKLVLLYFWRSNRQPRFSQYLFSWLNPLLLNMIKLFESPFLFLNPPTCVVHDSPCWMVSETALAYPYLIFTKAYPHLSNQGFIRFLWYIATPFHSAAKS